MSVWRGGGNRRLSLVAVEGRKRWFGWFWFWFCLWLCCESSSGGCWLVGWKGNGRVARSRLVRLRLNHYLKWSRDRSVSPRRVMASICSKERKRERKKEKTLSSIVHALPNSLTTTTTTTTIQTIQRTLVAWWAF